LGRYDTWATATLGLLRQLGAVRGSGGTVTTCGRCDTVHNRRRVGVGRRLGREVRSARCRYRSRARFQPARSGVGRRLDIPAGAASGQPRDPGLGVRRPRRRLRVSVDRLDSCSQENAPTRRGPGRPPLRCTTSTRRPEGVRRAGRPPRISPRGAGRAYWVGVERLWQEWFELCHTSARGVSGELRDLLGGSTRCCSATSTGSSRR